MKSFLLIIFVLISFAYANEAASPSPPSLSDNFVSIVSLDTIYWTYTNITHWSGVFAQSLTNQSRLQILNESTYDIMVLERHDLGVKYSYIPTINYCKAEAIIQPIQPVFQWLSSSSYAGEAVINVQQTHLFQVQTPQSITQMFINSQTNNPVRLVTENDSSTLIVNWIVYDPSAPPSDYFTVPSYCPSHPPATSMTQEELLANHNIHLDHINKKIEHFSKIFTF